MKKDQSLFDITRGCLEGLENVISKYQPGLIFVFKDRENINKKNKL
jgi:UDP-N-acetylglucosamine 2-epimerase